MLRSHAGYSGVCDAGARGSSNPDTPGLHILREVILQGIFISFDPLFLTPKKSSSLPEVTS